MGWAEMNQKQMSVLDWMARESAQQVLEHRIKGESCCCSKYPEEEERKRRRLGLVKRVIPVESPS